MKRHKAAKARTVAHHHKHVKPAHAHHKAATGHAHKHHKAHKHHHIAKKHKGQVHRGLAIGDAAACCAAEALAASLRLAGLSVADEDVLALYFNTARHPDEGASIEETLEAAWLYGLGGVRPASHDQISLPLGQLHAAALGELDELAARGFHGGSLILGVDLPGPHTVLATPDGWWSWGELWCPWCEFPDAVIEEAWEVAWL